MNEKQLAYLGHASQCLKIAGEVTDRASRISLREMAAAWVKLVEEDTTVAREVPSSPSPDDPR